VSDDVLRTRLTCGCGATMTLAVPNQYSTTFRFVSEAWFAAHREHAKLGSTRVVPFQRSGSE
jgi:hypothetical protein